MSSLPSNLQGPVNLAAELRACGHSWDAVGERLKRSAETCRRWPQRYPEEWRRLYRTARVRHLSELGVEAAVILRKLLLRSAAERVQLTAGQVLLKTELQVTQLSEPADAARAENELHRFADFLAGLSDNEVAALATQLVARLRQADAASAPADPAASAPEEAAGPPEADAPGSPGRDSS